MSTFMKQCVLRKTYDDVGYRVTTSWLPEKFAVVGTYVKLKDDDGWLVESVGNKRMTSEECSQNSREHTKMSTYQRK